MSYHDALQEDQRLVILRNLNELHGHSANDSILHTVLESYGHSISRDKVKTELRWLQEQNLISIKELPGCLVCHLSARGQDVALGRAVVDGVKRPAPRG